MHKIDSTTVSGGTNWRSIVGAILIAFISGSLTHIVLTDPSHAFLVGIVVLLVALWTNEGLPLGVVSLLPLILFPAFGILDLKLTANNYANPVIFLFLGGFMLAIAIQKTGLHQFFAHIILSKKAQTVRRIIFSLGLVAALMSSLLSNTTTALLLLSVALSLSEEQAFRARYVLAVAYGASIGGIITPIGTPPNLILMGFLESQNLPSITFVNWMVMTLPLAIMILAIMPWILSFGLPKTHSPFTIHNSQQKMTKKQRKLTYTLGFLALMLLLNSAIEPWYSGLGLDEKLVMLSFGLFMFIPGINFLTWKDTQSIPYEIIFLFGAGFSIANAFMGSGLAEVIASSLQDFSQLPTLVLIIFIALLITFSTEVTSNTALISLALPIIYSLGQVAQINTNLILMVVTISGSYAFMLPIATASTMNYAIVAQSVEPHLSGRVTTSFNLLIFLIAFFLQWGLGKIIEQWGSTNGAYPGVAYQYGIGITMALQIPGLLLWLSFKPWQRVVEKQE